MTEPTTDHEPYPCRIGVFCDDCGTTAARDYLVNDAMDQAARFAAARRHLTANEDWNCDPATGRDLCPECATTQDPAEPVDPVVAGFRCYPVPGHTATDAPIEPT